MSVHEIADCYDAMFRDSQTYFLASLIHELSMSIRDYYNASVQIVNSHQGSPVGGLNEAQHQVSGHLVDVLTRKPDRARGKSIVDSVMEWARIGQAERSAEWAFERAFQRTMQHVSSTRTRLRRDRQLSKTSASATSSR